jgi:hypothetical protein
VERILADVRNQSVHLPLMKFALTQPWAHRERHQIRHADATYGCLEGLRQQEARRVSLPLMRPGEGMEDTRRIAPREELGEGRWFVGKALADARWVVTSRR